MKIAITAFALLCAFTVEASADCHEMSGNFTVVEPQAGLAEPFLQGYPDGTNVTLTNPGSKMVIVQTCHKGATADSCDKLADIRSGGATSAILHGFDYVLASSPDGPFRLVVDYHYRECAVSKVAPRSIPKP